MSTTEQRGTGAQAARALSIYLAIAATCIIARVHAAQAQSAVATAVGDAQSKQSTEVHWPESAPGPRSLLLEVPGYPSVTPSAGTSESIAAKTPTLLYLNRGGGVYTPANCAGTPSACNDSQTNVSSVLESAVEMPAWSVDAGDWQYVVECVEEMLAPFNVEVSDVDPGERKHIESYIGGSPLQMGLPGTVAGVSPARSDCGIIEDSITFVYPEVLGGDLRRTCETIAQEFAHSIGLDHLFLCEDPMSYLSDCGAKRFQFVEAPCGEYSARECRCGGDTENSAKLLLEKLGRSEAPAIWLSEPRDGALVDPAGFSVTATVTRPPVSIEIFVDGVLVATELPNLDSSAAFQKFTHQASTQLRPGTHHIQVNARYPDSDHSVTALIKVRDQQLGGEVLGGCSAGGRAGDLSLLLGLLALLPLLRTSRSRLALLATALLGSACSEGIYGNQQATTTCELPTYEGVDQVGLIYSRSGGSCTATLIGPQTVLTAAHCAVASSEEPLIALFRIGSVYTQYIATAVTTHPAYVPGELGVSSADLAILRLNEEVPMEAMPLYAAAPALGERISLIAFDSWSPLLVTDPRPHSVETRASGVDTESDLFHYEDPTKENCLEARSGGLVVGTSESGSQHLLGILGHDDEIIRLDNYACWVACEPAAQVPAALVPAACACESTEIEECGECGIREPGGACLPRPDLHPCAEGLVCSDEALCQQEEEPVCAPLCSDISGTPLCEGESGFRECPNNPEGFQRCECGSSGSVNQNCTPGCLF